MSRVLRRSLSHGRSTTALRQNPIAGVAISQHRRAFPRSRRTEEARQREEVRERRIKAARHCDERREYTGQQPASPFQSRGPQQPRQERSGFEHSQLRAVRGEESSPGVEHRCDGRGHGIAEQLASQQERPRPARGRNAEQASKQDARRDSDQVKRPMQRVPRAGLRIGKNGVPEYRKRRPLWQPPGVHGIGKIFRAGYVT